MLVDLHGRPDHRKRNVNEPQPSGDLQEPPEWMSEAQKDGWRYAIANAPPGLLKRIDRGALTVWTAAEALHRQALMLQANLPIIIKAPVTGAMMQSPFLAIINRQGIIMLKAASELGFSPVSRPRIGASSIPSSPRMFNEKTNGKTPAGPRRSLDDFLEDAPAYGPN